jgi:ABC-type bacteriocin/lantibiotic exporter with double-glycine peptidase domain
MFKIHNKFSKIIDNDYKKNNFLFILFLLVTSFLEILSISIIFPSLTLILETDKLKDLKFINSYFPEIYQISKINLLIYFIVFFAFLNFIKSCFLIFFTFWRNNLVTSYENKIGLNLYKKYLRLPYIDFILSNSAIFSKNIVVETRKARQSYDAFMKLINEIIVISSITLVLIIYEPYISFIVILFFGLVGLTMLSLLKPKLINIGKKQVLFAEKLFQNLNEGFGLFKEIKIRENYNFFIQKFNSNFYGVLHSMKLKAIISESVKISLEFITILFFCVIIFILSLQLSDLKTLIPTLSLFGAAAYRFIPALSRIISYNQLIQSNQYAFNTILKDFSTLENKYFEKKDVYFTNFKNNIEFINVYFKYKESSDYIIKNLSFKINKLDFICLLGKSGEGKTTLIDLIAGILEPTKGKILADGKKINLNKNWKRNIGYIPQNIYLFDETIKKNIILDDFYKKINLDKALKLSYLENLVKTKGLNYKVGEKGSRLSGGQAQRVGIARSLYNFPSLLICDEISSSLDKVNENKIINSLKFLKNKLTVICVTHNPNAFKFSFVKKYTLIRDKEGNSKLVKIY